MFTPRIYRGPEGQAEERTPTARASSPVDSLRGETLTMYRALLEDQFGEGEAYDRRLEKAA